MATRSASSSVRSRPSTACGQHVVGQVTTGSFSSRRSVVGIGTPRRHGSLVLCITSNRMSNESIVVYGVDVPKVTWAFKEKPSIVSTYRTANCQVCDHKRRVDIMSTKLHSP